MYKIAINSPVGLLRMESDGVNITGLRSLYAPDAMPDAPCEALERAKAELARYFAGTLTVFASPLLPSGTAFQKKVWNAILKIPYGQTASYGEIAREIQNETASRAVGRACGLNPIWILIPCHRVVGASGLLTGYAGGTEAKRFLLELEKRSVPLLRK